MIIISTQATGAKARRSSPPTRGPATPSSPAPDEQQHADRPEERSSAASAATTSPRRAAPAGSPPSPTAAGSRPSTIAFLIPAADEVGALDENDVDASGAAVLHHLSNAFFIGTEYALPVLFFASALLSLRHGALPKWLGRLSVLIGIVLLIGPIGWAALIFPTPLWTLNVSVLLWRRAEVRSAAGEPALGTPA